MSKKSETKDAPENTSFPLRMPKTLDQAMAEGAEKTGLSKSDFMRLSMQRGAELLVKALSLSAEQLANIPDNEPAEAA